MKHSRKWMTACLCAAILLGSTGCGTAQQHAQSLDFVTIKEGMLSQAQTTQAADFSYELLRQAAVDSDESVLIAPLSAWLALSMTAQGAVDDTARAFTIFFQGIDLEQQRQTAAWVLQKVQASDQLRLADSVWCDDEITVQDLFLQTAQQYYHAQVFVQDLQQQKTCGEINQWIANATKGNITDMLREINEDTVMLLVNALALDARWQSPFDANATYEQTFYRKHGETNMPFLHQRYEQAAYLQWPQGQGMMLPYEGGQLSLIVLLPNEDSGCQQVLQQLSAAWVGCLLADATERSVQLAMPKFEMSSVMDLSQICQAMGLEIAFDSNKADFSALGRSARGNLFLNFVLQNCQLKVDEDGTKAAAATVVEITDRCAPLEQEELVQLELNRPFVYLVVEQESQIPLFAGIYQGV